jgi:FkbM family methyltransferase
MSVGSLVAPIRVDSVAGWRNRLNDLVVVLLRSAATVSRRMFAGRGVGFACVLTARLLGHDGDITFRLAGGGVLVVPTSDRYWLQYLLLEGTYESDLDHFLHRCMTSDDVFLDCGANLGLWSIATSQIINDPRRVVAVEAGAETFARLEANAMANNRCFTVLHRAVGERSGDRVTFFASDSDHASSTVVEDLAPSDAAREEVETISLPDLIGERVPHADGGLTFVKLDIEGNECRALSTIPLAQGSKLVVLFEDHGRDMVHSGTRFLLDRGWAVAFIHDDGSIERLSVDRIERLSELKNDPNRGYNLVAVAPSGGAAARLLDRYPHSTLGT